MKNPNEIVDRLLEQEDDDPSHYDPGQFGIVEPGKRYADAGWVILKDFTDATSDDEWDAHIYQISLAEPNRRLMPVPPKFKSVTITGPRSMHPEVEKALMAGQGTLFRLWDDDGNCYYEGRWTSDASKLGIPPEQLRYSESNPLDDYGGPNAGAVTMTDGESNEVIL